MRRLVATLLLYSFFTAPVWAETMLTIHAGNKSIEISGEQFNAVKTVEHTTSTDWTDGANRFQGPLIKDVIESAGLDIASVETIRATAANDYSVAIPATDIIKYKVILATEMNGKRLTLRDKGPLWVVYPRDDHTELNDPEINARWIWQLIELKLE